MLFSSKAGLSNSAFLMLLRSRLSVCLLRESLLLQLEVHITS